MWNNTFFQLAGWIFLCVIIGYLLFVYIESTNNNLANISNSYYEDSFSNVNILHFPKMPITYTIDVNSGASNDNYEVKRIKWALQIISDSTNGLIKFQEVEKYDNPNLILYGLPLIEEDSNKRFIIKGLSSPIEVNESIINQSQIELYPTNTAIYGGVTHTEVDDTYIYTITEYDLREGISWSADDCDDFPQTEVHEILHAFGLGHNYNNSYSVMFPIRHKIQSCKTKEIDKEIISCLKYIYSNGEIEGDCSKLNFYPWQEEPEIKDFKWDSLPVSYSISDCNDRQKWLIQIAEKVIEDYVRYDLYKFNEFGKGKINFYCYGSFDNVLLNEETDFWDATIYFPSAQPYYNYDENEKIKDVKILLLTQNRSCGGIEVHEILHGLGLRNHYGHWMEYETELCDTNNMILSKETKEKIKGVYGLK